MSDNAPRTNSNQTDDWGGPARPPGPGGPEESGHEAEGLLGRLLDRLPYWLTWRETFLGGLLGIALLIVLVFMLAFVTTFFDSSSLSGSAEQIESARSSDTYEGWKSSLQAADEAVRSPPGGFRSFFHTLGFLVPGNSPHALRKEIKRKRAYVAAVLEYRFESDGSRQAAHHAWEAFPQEAMTPLSAASRTYRLLSRGYLGQAVAVSNKARKSFQQNPLVLRAHLEAALAARLAGESSRAADALAKSDSTTGYDQLLLARAVPYEPKGSKISALDELASEGGSAPLDASIEKVSALASQGEGTKAISLGNSLLEEHAKAASPYQLAKLHNAIGDAHAATDKTERARKSYKRAIEALPSRTSVYIPFVDHLIAQGDLEDAEEQLSTAEMEAGPTPQLAVLEAQLSYFRGRFDRALSTLEGTSNEVDLAPLLRARILLAKGSFADAKKRLEAIAESHPQRASIEALTQLATAGTSSKVSESQLKKVDALASEHGDNPTVLRAAARVRIQAARAAGEGEREDLLEKAVEYADKSEELQPQRAANDFLLCEIYRLQENAKEARKYCDRGIEENDSFLPGMLTAARLEFLEQTPSEAALLLARLAGAFDDSWKVAKLRIRSLLRTHRPQRAGALLAEWRAHSVSKRPEFDLFEGHVAFFRGNYKDAIEHYRRAQKSDAYKKEAQIYTAHTLVRLGNFEEAEKLVLSLKENDRWSAAAWTIFGELRLRQEEKLDAIENLRIATRHYDWDVDPLWRISHVYGQRALAWRIYRDWNDSRVKRYLERGSNRGDPDSPEILFAQGLYYLNVLGTDNDPARAAKLLERVVDIQPYRCEAIDALKVAYEETHDYGGIRRMEKLKKENCK